MLKAEPELEVALELKQALRYGENPHQKGAVYVAPACGGVSVLTAKQLHGGPNQ